MFFLISKLFWVAAAPLNFLLGLLVIGELLTKLGARRIGRRMRVTALAVLLVVAVGPIGGLLLRPLEDRFPMPPATLAAPTGIIVLGGSTDQELAVGRGRVTIADAGDRMTEAVVLSRRFPDSRVVFTGGSAEIGGSDDTEAADARRLWTAMGVADARITTEDRSRNTDENVRFSKPIVDPQPGQTWLLVTSAYHMPRAVALFRANDWPVIADPVDYRTTGTGHDFRPSLDTYGNLSRLSVALREWIGLVAYRLSGRTRTLLPGP